MEFQIVGFLTIVRVRGRASSSRKVGMPRSLLIAFFRFLSFLSFFLFLGRRKR
jgi:hypothetical protein